MQKEMRGSVWGYVEFYAPVGHELRMRYMDAKLSYRQTSQLKRGYRESVLDEERRVWEEDEEGQARVEQGGSREPREKAGSGSMNTAIIRDSSADCKMVSCLGFPTATCCFLLARFSD